MKKVDGQWRPVKAVLNGQTITTNLNGQIMENSGAQYKFGLDAGMLHYGAPGELDIIGVDGPNQGKTFKALYAISPDFSEMTLCYNVDGGDRPTVFLSPKGKGLLLITYANNGLKSSNSG